MNGIIKYNKKLYRKTKKNPHELKKGDLVILECKRNSDYFKYNGVYEVVDDRKCIHIKREGELTLCLKLGYNVFDYNKLELNTKVKKSLPKNIVEEEYYG